MSTQDTGSVSAPVPASRTPYQLDLPQTTEACRVLLQHIGDRRKRRLIETPEKPNLLTGNADAAGDDDSSEQDDIPIWMIVTTKKHIVDKPRLKPSKIALPHPLSKNTSSTICLITSDPQSLYSEAVAQPSFPPALRKRITRVIGLSKLKSLYRSFESRRQLLAEHDIFLCDDRVVTYLPQVLGKIFYKGGAKRPVPVNIAGPASKSKPNPEQQRRSTKDGEGRGVVQPPQLAKEIEKALASALIHLAPGVSTAVKVGRAAFTPEMCMQNVQAVVQGLVDRFVTKGWRNIRAIHVKGPNTTAFPIWLASELWVDEEDVLEYEKNFGKKGPKKVTGEEKAKTIGQNTEASELARKESGKASKRKTEENEQPAKIAKKQRKAEAKAKLAADISSRKFSIKQQKLEVMAEVDKVEG